MMPGAVFGDFLAAADAHLEAAVAVSADEIAWPSAAAGELHRLVAVMSRYCDDLAPCDEIDASSRDDLHPRERAAIDAGAALRTAAGYLHRSATKASSHLVSETSAQRVRHLAAAATELEAGRDLLHTHLAVDSYGLTIDRSEWASAVTSVPVARALANEVRQWSLRLARFATWLAGSAVAYAGPDEPGQSLRLSLCAELATANQWLMVADTVIGTALKVDAVRPADAELLRAIPAASVPQRQPPGSTAESVAELCDGIAVSASRMRGATRGSTDRARSSPGVTSGGWQWTAQAAAVTAHLSELVLRALAARARQLPGLPVAEVQLSDAADLLADMRTAWHEADRAWDVMITETRMLATQGMADASDLVLRVGRLAWDDPHWTPARSRQASQRNPAALAPDGEAVAAVVAAVHQSVDALACVARADMNAVEVAGRAGRLYVPTRSLPERRGVSRAFADAPDSRRQALHEAYRAALDASLQGARALDELAVAANAPSRVLALARAAASAQSRRRVSQAQPDVSVPGDPMLFDEPFLRGRVATGGNPGPVEQAIRELRVHDLGMLMRAAAIDNAARQLMIQAENAVSASRSPDTPATVRRSAGNSAQLAVQSFPRSPTPSPTAAQPPERARHAASPGSRFPRTTA